MQARFLRGSRDTGQTLEDFRKETEERDPRREDEELHAKLVLLEGELASYRERESLIGETLLAAQAAAKELRQAAENDSEAMRLKAQADVDALGEQSKRECEAMLVEARSDADEVRRGADELNQRAEQEGEAILAQARAEADEISRAAASERRDLESEIERLRTMRTDVEEAVRSLLFTTLDALEGSASQPQLAPVLADALKSRVTEAGRAVPEGPREIVRED